MTDETTATATAVAAERDRIIDVLLTTCLCGYIYNEWTGEQEQAQDCPTHGEPSARYYAKLYAHLVDPDRARAAIAAQERPTTVEGFLPADADTPF
jgi:hypothetical protein